MTAQQLVGLCVRLFAAWLVLSAVSLFVVATQSSAGPRGDVMATYGLVTGIVYLVAAVLLWSFPLTVANRLLPRTRHEDPLSLRAHELARVGCAVLGLWLFAQALPALIRFLILTIGFAGPSSAFSSLTPAFRIDVAVNAVEMLFAILLVAKARVFARLVMSDTEAPVEARPEADETSPRPER